MRAEAPETAPIAERPKKRPEPLIRTVVVNAFFAAVLIPKAVHTGRPSSSTPKTLDRGNQNTDEAIACAFAVRRKPARYTFNPAHPGLSRFGGG
jgi:hypothetical protein